MMQNEATLSKYRPFKLSGHQKILVAVLLGFLTSYLDYVFVKQVVHIVEHSFINLFKFVSLPIIFLSILSAFSRIEHVSEVRLLGKNVFKFTLVTTAIAALIALLLYIAIKPAALPSGTTAIEPVSDKAYLDYLLAVIPDNILQPFIEYNLISVIFIAFTMGFATLSLPKENRALIKNLFVSLMDLFLKITEMIIRFIPLAIWAFVASLMEKANASEHFMLLLPYIACVILANLIQALVVLPLFLRMKNLSPGKLLKKTSSVLWLAFVTKSSSSVLPMSIKCAVDDLKLSPKVANFSLPLCTTVNMNACASFILITILFASQSYGLHFSTFDYVAILIFSVIAAIGNAGVPMGCYFMTTSFLVATDVPLTMMNMILPVYVFLDMLETAINVWSDICITAVVDKECQANEA